MNFDVTVKFWDGFRHVISSVLSSYTIIGEFDGMKIVLGKGPDFEIAWRSTSKELEVL